MRDMFLLEDLIEVPGQFIIEACGSLLTWQWKVSMFQVASQPQSHSVLSESLAKRNAVGGREPEKYVLNSLSRRDQFSRSFVLYHLPRLLEELLFMLCALVGGPPPTLRGTVQNTASSIEPLPARCRGIVQVVAHYVHHGFSTRTLTEVNMLFGPLSGIAAFA